MRVRLISALALCLVVSSSALALEQLKAETMGEPQRAPFKRPSPEENAQSLLRLARRLGIVPWVDKAGAGPLAMTLLVGPGSLAEKAGLRAGDGVAALNGVSFGRVDAAPAQLSQLRLNDGLYLTVLREGKPVDVVVPAEVFKDFLGPPVKPLDGGLFEVTFSYRPSKSAKPPKSVYLAGTFNNWGPTAHKMDGPGKEGLFTTRLKLRKGTYEYKFVLEGKDWQSHNAGFWPVNAGLRLGTRRDPP